MGPAAVEVAVVDTKGASLPWNTPRRVFLTQPQPLSGGGVILHKCFGGCMLTTEEAMLTDSAK